MAKTAAREYIRENIFDLWLGLDFLESTPKTNRYVLYIEELQSKYAEWKSDKK